MIAYLQLAFKIVVYYLITRSVDETKALVTGSLVLWVVIWNFIEEGLEVVVCVDGGHQRT
jgi:hypothetical protein